MVILERDWVTPFIIGAVFFLTLQASAWSDTVHLYNGQVIHGAVQGVAGELVTLKLEHGEKTIIPRLEITSRQDVVETRKHQQILGEVIYMTPFALEMKTARGKIKLWRVLVKNIILGRPQAPDGQFIETDSQLQGGN